MRCSIDIERVTWSHPLTQLRCPAPERQGRVNIDRKNDGIYIKGT